MKINERRISRCFRSSMLLLKGSMKGIFLCGIIMLMVSRTALAIEALPGSTWGSLTMSVNGLTGSGSMGWINQGIDWFTLPGGITFNTYAEYRYRSQSEQYQYYNAQGPVLGFELKKSFLRLGMDYFWERFPAWPGGGTSSRNREYYMSGFYGWDVNRDHKDTWLGTAGLPGSVWFNMTYDINGLTGSGAMGWIHQGIDWFTTSDGFTFNTYAEYRYRTETKQYEYYNAQGPALGLEFKKGDFRAGTDYYWQTYPDWPGGTQRSYFLELYLSWYINWDLGRSTK